MGEKSRTLQNFVEITQIKTQMIYKFYVNKHINEGAIVYLHLSKKYNNLCYGRGMRCYGGPFRMTDYISENIRLTTGV